VDVGGDGEGALSVQELRSRFDAVVLATGASVPRELEVPGREASGIHPAMDYLTQANRLVEGDWLGDPISAEGKDVVIIGGGDTGADCLGTALRQGARSVTTLAIGTQPPSERDESQPWPTHPVLFEVSTAHEEGGARSYLASTTGFEVDADGAVTGLRVARTGFVDGRRVPTPGTDTVLPATLVLIAMGFTGAREQGLLEQLGVEMTSRGNIVHDGAWATSVPGVFTAGDCARGQSLIVWAIAEGRSCAAAVDEHLMGLSSLPRPVRPGEKPVTV
jgi:glutamate synthase (NADPH/NADH) small chain